MQKQDIPWRIIGIFIFLSYFLLWFPFLIVKLLESGGESSSLWATILGIMGPYSPLIAAILTRTIIAKEGFKDSRLQVKNVKWQYWFLAILFPFFWNGIQDIFQLSFGFTELDVNEIIKGLYRIPINLFGGLIIFIGEEFGWRSYLLEKLRPLGRWNAFLLSGIVWSLWHLPVLIFPALKSGSNLELLGVLLSLFIFVLFGFIFGWLYIESNSVWPCVLMHSYNNLITLKLFNWKIINEPSLWQNSLMAVGPIFLIWLILFFKGKFYGEAN